MGRVSDDIDRVCAAGACAPRPQTREELAESIRCLDELLQGARARATKNGRRWRAAEYDIEKLQALLREARPWVLRGRIPREASVWAKWAMIARIDAAAPPPPKCPDCGEPATVESSDPDLPPRCEKCALHYTPDLEAGVEAVQ